MTNEVQIPAMPLEGLIPGLSIEGQTQTLSSTPQIPSLSIGKQIPALSSAGNFRIPGLELGSGRRGIVPKPRTARDNVVNPMMNIVNHSARDGNTGLTSPPKESHWLTTSKQSYSVPTRPSNNNNNNQRARGGNPRDKWLRLDRQVLRFYMYFKEAVQESSIEAQRARKCILLYYLADDSIEVVEPKEKNSGLPQGVFMRRAPIVSIKGRDDQNNDLHFSKLSVGTNLTLMGRTFRLVDADESTRKFYETEFTTIKQGEAETYPDCAGVPTPRYEDTRQHEETMEQSARRRNKSAGMGVTYPVLNFEALWTDPRSTEVGGDTRYFSVHYFVENNTMEVRCMPTKNSGRITTPMFLNRCVVPRKDTDGQGNYVRLEHLVCGKNVSVYGRAFQILSCDKQTKTFYAGMGVDQIKVVIPEVKQKTRKMLPPPPTGFGSEEDSLGSFYHLQPQKAKKRAEMLQSKNNSLKGDITEQSRLQLVCRLKSDSPLDMGREFVLQFFLANDTLSIFEVSKRNSGVWGGKFLERSRYINPDTKEKFRSDDFFAPLTKPEESPISIMGRTFIVLRGDSFTRGFFNQLEEKKEETTAEKIFQRLVNRMLVKRVNVRKMFQEVDADGSKSISKSEFKLMLDRFDMALHDEDIDAVMAKFANGKSEIWYNDFCDIISSRWTPPKQNSQDRIDMLEQTMLTKLRDSNSQLRKVFRKFDEDKNGVLTFTEFQQMMEYYSFDLTPYELTELMARYDADRAGTIDYNEFCDKVYQCDFSSALDDHEVKIKVDNEEINVVDYMSRLEKEEEAMKSKLSGKDVMRKLVMALAPRKFELRKAFLARDFGRTGRLDVAGFFDAVETVRSDLAMTDEDKYGVCTTLFPDPADPSIDFEQFLAMLMERSYN